MCKRMLAMSVSVVCEKRDQCGMVLVTSFMQLLM